MAGHAVALLREIAQAPVVGFPVAAHVDGRCAGVGIEPLRGGGIVLRVFFRGFAGWEGERDKHAQSKAAKRLHGAKNFQIPAEM
jgi:hypothetical protein